MKFLKRMLGINDDPTAGWGAAGAPLPPLDLSTMRFGSLGFGDPLESARFLGRPDAVEWPSHTTCRMIYGRGGYQLDFESGVLDFATFFISPDEFDPKTPSFRHAEAALAGGGRITGSAKREELERLFGAPTYEENDDEEIILTFFRNGVSMEFEFTPDATRLKRWMLYGDVPPGGQEPEA